MTMRKHLYLFALVPTLLAFEGVARAQYPIMDDIANKIVQRYRQSSCEQLWQRRGKPHSPREQEAVQLLRGDPQMRAVFISKIAAPIANKMFECGMIP
jgi:hypothetical protein